MSEVTIRKARPDELKTIQDLNYQLFLFDLKNDPELNMQWPHEEEGEDYFRRTIAEEIGICFVAEIDGKVVGYLAGCITTKEPSYRPVKRAEMENMFVLEEHRRSGVGTKLVETFITWAHSKGIKHVFVSAYAGNEKAINFYKKVGFAPRALELEIT